MGTACSMSLSDRLPASYLDLHRSLPPCILRPVATSCAPALLPLATCQRPLSSSSPDVCSAHCQSHADLRILPLQDGTGGDGAKPTCDAPERGLYERRPVAPAHRAHHHPADYSDVRPARKRPYGSYHPHKLFWPRLCNQESRSRHQRGSRLFQESSQSQARKPSSTRSNGHARAAARCASAQDRPNCIYT